MIDIEYPIRATAYSEMIDIEKIKDHKHETKVCTIEFDSKVVMITPRKDIEIASICILKEPFHGDVFTIQLVNENEDLVEDIHMSENMIRLLALAVEKYKET